MRADPAGAVSRVLVDRQSKFKLQQHPSLQGMQLDVATVLEQFPRDATDGKPPTIIRDVAMLNGVPIGWDHEARKRQLMLVVDNLSRRVKVLTAYIPLIGRQR
eukprot:5671551-Prymnesium_polylepis.1